MNQKNKAFTLIELLAVIIILAIIALIATPIILNIIEKARKNAFVDTAYGLMDAAKLQYTEGILDHTPTSKSYTFPQSGTDILKFSGNEPQGGTLNIDAQGNIELAIHDGNWCVTKGINDSKVSIQKYGAETCKIAEHTTPEKCFEFDASTGTITKYRKSDLDCPMDVAIPDTIGGTTVKIIGEYAFLENYDGNGVPTVGDTRYITSVVLPSGLEVIELGAFVGKFDFGETIIYNQLTNVDFSKATKLQTIGMGAFSYNQLTSVEIPNSVTSIGDSAFNDNQLPDDQAFIYARNSDGSVDNTKIVSYGGAKRDNVIIPSNVTSIGNYAFEHNQLTSVTIPNGVTSIGDCAFNDNQLTSVVIPNSVTSIGDSAFLENQLTSVTIPDSVTSIGDYAFSQNQLTSVTIQGKSSSSDFTTYGTNIWRWASGYSDSNIIWNGASS